MKDKIKTIIKSSIDTKNRLLTINAVDKIEEVANLCIVAINSGNSIYFCGNGGSAADAQHLAAELSGRFYRDRKPLPSEALHTNTSYLTAVANDYGYEFVYSRLINAIGKNGDVLIGLSTSGKSANVINAFREAQSLKMRTIGLTGRDYCSKFNTICDVTINVPSDDTPRIQEAHLLIGHIVCQLIEESIK